MIRHKFEIIFYIVISCILIALDYLSSNYFVNVSGVATEGNPLFGIFLNPLFASLLIIAIIVSGITCLWICSDKDQKEVAFSIKVIRLVFLLLITTRVVELTNVLLYMLGLPRMF